MNMADALNGGGFSPVAVRPAFHFQLPGIVGKDFSSLEYSLTPPVQPETRSPP